MEQTIKAFTTYRLVKSEDLNHHKTLFAGRGAEWFVEAGYIAATSMVNPETLVCAKIHGMRFLKPARGGEIIYFESKVVYAGKSSVFTYIRANIRSLNGEDSQLVDGFITFVNVDADTKPCPHGITIVPTNAEDQRLHDMAKALKSSPQ